MNKKKIPRFNFPVFNQELTIRLNHTQKIFQELSERITEAVEDLISNTPESLVEIAKHGWFVHYETNINLPQELSRMIRDNHLIEFNDKLESHYHENFDYIIEELIKRHPHRSSIFREISSSYKTGMYNIMIPTLLTQSDGICYDLTNKKLFQQRNNKPAFLENFTIEKGSLLELYIQPLTTEIPVYAGTKSQSNYPCNINRHLILHGMDYEYGSKTNSLKSLSLTKYISDLLYTEL